MGEITVNYYSSAMTATKRASDKFAIPDGGVKASLLKRAILTRYPNTGIDNVLESCRWLVDGQSIDPHGPYVLKDGDDVEVIPRLVGG
jgi:molybdopterin converting factor small subunit